MSRIKHCFNYLAAFCLTVACAAPDLPPHVAGAPAAATPSVTDQAATGPSVLVTAELGSPHIGELAPDFELTDQSGSQVRLSELRGSVVVLAFVTSYCPFSRAAQPHLADLARDFAAQGVRVVAVDVAENDAQYSDYVTRMQLPFPVLHDPEGATSLLFTPSNASPGVKDRTQVIVTSNLVIDREGRIRFFTLLDTTHFDDKLVHVRRALEQTLKGA